MLGPDAKRIMPAVHYRSPPPLVCSCARQNLPVQLQELPIERKIKTIRALTLVGNNGTAQGQRQSLARFAIGERFPGQKK